MLIKLGIIGLGHMGGYHASASSLLPNVELSCVADPSIKNWSKIKSTKVLKSKNYKEWIDLVDAVIIAVPTKLHFEIAKYCIEKKKHVLLEKPLTSTVQEAIELFRLANKHNVSLHVGHVERFNGAVQELNKIVQEPYLIESHRIGPFSPRPKNDSVVLDLMIHDLDIILNLVQSPIKILSAVGNKIYTDKPDLAVVQIGFENGTNANIISSRASQIKRRTMSIHQKDCFLQLDFTTQDISIHRNINDSVKIGNKQMKYSQEGTVQRLFVYKDNPLKLEVEHFVKSIRSGKKTLQPEQDTIALKLALEIDRILGEQNIHIVKKIEPTTQTL